MVVENLIAEFALNNGIGVFFGVLMYLMATKTIKENTQAIRDLSVAINSWHFHELNET